MQTKKLHRRNSGFTLIELLVVIAIIAILAAILFPAFARARENARRASCQSNLKQISLGIMQYTQDYDESFPYRTNDANSPMVGWPVAVMPYVKSEALFKCASDPTKPVTANKNTLSYAMNYNAISVVAGSGPVKLSAFNAPVKTVMLLEIRNTQCFFSNPTTLASEWSQSVTMGREGYDGNSSPNPRAATGKLAGADIGSGIDPNDGSYVDKFARHLEGSNFLAADGHVKWLKAATVSGGSNATSETAAMDANVSGAWYSSAAGTSAAPYALTFSIK